MLTRLFKSIILFAALCVVCYAVIQMYGVWAGLSPFLLLSFTTIYKNS
jgi:hypothetical protein